MAHIKDGVELTDAEPVPRLGRWASAIIIALFALLLVHTFVTNPNFQ